MTNHKPLNSGYHSLAMVIMVYSQGRNQRGGGGGGGKGGIAPPPVKVLCPPSRVRGLWNYIKRLSTATQYSTSMYCTVQCTIMMHAFML